MAPAARRELLAEALATAELDAIPTRPAALRAFVEGALFSVLTRWLELRDSVELIAQLRATLELAFSAQPEEEAGSEVRPCVPLPSTPTAVWVVTSASLVVFLLGDILGDDADVVPITDESKLRERLERTKGRPIVLVVDRKHPAVDLSICTLLREELDPHSTVIWWGASPAERTMASAALAGGPRLIPCETEVGLADLAELCGRLLDGSS